MSVTWHNLDAFKRELAAQPETLTQRSEPIVAQASVKAADEVRAGYSSPHLRQGVSATPMPTEKPTVITWKVRNSAPHAHLYEYGTETVRITGTGAERGRMPAHPVFFPAVGPAGRSMVDELKRMVTAEGYRVSGDGSPT